MKIEDLETKDAPHANIWILGAGLSGYEQLTAEAKRILRHARIVFFSRYNGDPTSVLRELGSTAEARDLEQGEYLFGTYRPTMYARMADRILDVAREVGSGVVVLQPGSAVVVDTVTQNIVAGAQRLGLRVEIISGISCVEAVLADLHYDLTEGIQIVTAQQLMLKRLELSPAFASLIIQPGYFDTRWWIGSARSRPERFVELQSYLLKFFPPHAPMVFVIAPIRSSVGRNRFWLKLENLSRLYPFISPFHTLFVPPLEGSDHDPELEHRIDSFESALANVERDQAGRVLMQDESQWCDPAIAGVFEDLLDESRVLQARWDARRT